MVPPTLFGSVRYNVGDELCDGTADGTPCDDRDACTVDASCAAGRCVGGSRASCGGDIGHCREPGVCNPIDAACTAPSAKPYGTACEDGNVCTETHCDGGECVRTRGMDCNDANACTDDFCDAATGCRHLAVPGQCGAAGVSGTLAFVREVSADPDDRGAVQAFGPPDGPVFGNAYFGENTAGTVSIAFSTDDFGYQPFTFGAAAGERLGAGVYENATPFRMPGELRPVLSVSVPAFCYEGVGRFVVHEVTYGQATELVAFAADFEMACEGRRFEGAVRWRAGSTACHDAPDGTPCDDSNACTATSSCLGGACAGGGATVCAPTSDDCVETIACHPSSGACVAGATQDDLPCDAPDECIAAGVCRRGRCSTPRAPCDDANPCTIDRCEALDCVHDPIAGTCWSVRTQTAVGIRTAQGTSCRCTLQTERLLLALTDDGAVFGERPRCDDAEGPTTDAVHAWTLGKRGRLELALDPIGTCGAVLFPLENFVATGWAKIRPRGLTGVQKQRWTLGRGNVGSSVTRLVGRATDGSTMPRATPWRTCRAMRRCLHELSGE